MAFKTLTDCAHCPNLTKCDAHVNGGTHRHLEGPDPCEWLRDNDPAGTPFEDSDSQPVG